MIPSKSAKTFETRSSTLWLDGDIVIIQIKQGAELGISDIKEMSEISKQLWESKKVKVFSDMRGIKSITREARKFSTAQNSEFKDSVVASAILINNYISKSVGNMILKVDKPPYPTRLFTDTAEAEKWLKKFDVNDRKSKGNKSKSGDLQLL
jgi:hypothetical protein